MNATITRRIIKPIQAMDLKVILIYIASVMFYKTVMHLEFHAFIVEQHILAADQLTHDLFRSLFYMHMLPPLGNLIMGLMMKTGWPIALLHKWIYAILGLVAVVFLNKALMVLGIRSALRIAVICLVCAMPTFHLYANWGYFHHLEFCFCCPLVYFLARLTDKNRLEFRDGLGVFIPCCLLGLTRPQWHLVLFLALFLIVISFKRKAVGRHRFTLGSAAALSPLIVWYLKNLILYGFFGASSWMGCNLSLVTETMGLPHQELNKLIASGEVSPFAAVTWSPQKIENSAQYFEKSGYVLPAITHPSLTIEDNKLITIPACRQSLLDSLVIIRHFPYLYINRVFSKMQAITYMPSFTCEFCNISWIGLNYGNWSPGLRMAISRISRFFYFYIPVIVFAAALLQRGYAKQNRMFILSVIFVISSTMLIGCMFNGIEQERMRWGQAPVYITLLAMLLEMIMRDGMPWLRSVQKPA